MKLTHPTTGLEIDVPDKDADGWQAIGWKTGQTTPPAPPDKPTVTATPAAAETPEKKEAHNAKQI